MPTWEPSRERRPPEAVLLEQAAARVPELVPFGTGGRWRRRSPSSAARAALMAADLAETPQSGLPVQLCGDAHLSNFGGFASPDRLKP